MDAGHDNQAVHASQIPERKRARHPALPRHLLSVAPAMRAAATDQRIPYGARSIHNGNTSSVNRRPSR